MCPFTFYMHGWVLMIYTHSFQHHVASQAVISPAILVPRERPSMPKKDPLARIWHNDYTNLCNNSTCRTVLGQCCRCWEQVFSKFVEIAGLSPAISKNFENINFTFPNQSHIRTYHRQVNVSNLPAIVHFTTHTPLCMSWMRNCTLKQVILIQWINGLLLRMGIFCHKHCGKLWIHVGLSGAIASK